MLKRSLFTGPDLGPPQARSFNYPFLLGQPHRFLVFVAPPENHYLFSPFSVISSPDCDSSPLMLGRPDGRLTVMDSFIEAVR